MFTTDALDDSHPGHEDEDPEDREVEEVEAEEEEASGSAAASVDAELAVPAHVAATLLAPHVRLLSKLGGGVNSMNHSCSSTNDKYLDCNEEFVNSINNANNATANDDNLSTYHDANEYDDEELDEDEEDTDLKRFERVKLEQVAPPLDPERLAALHRTHHHHQNHQATNNTTATTPHLNEMPIHSKPLNYKSLPANGNDDDSVEIANLINQFRQLNNDAANASSLDANKINVQQNSS